MFPAVNDFNSLVCGMATFAATVGYVCARKFTGDIHLTSHTDLQPTIITAVESPETTSEVHSPNSSESAATTPVPAGLGRRSSLKRKRVQDDQDDAAASGYPHNLALIYPPKKRSRTPTSEADTEVVDCHPSTVDNLATQDMKATPPPKPVENPSEKVKQTVAIEDPTSTPPSTPKPAARVAVIANVPKTPPAFRSPAFASSPWNRTTPGPASRAVTSNAFAAFAGSASPFASMTPPNSLSKDKKPIWTSPSGGLSACSTQLTDTPGTPVSNEIMAQSRAPAGKPGHALEAATAHLPVSIVESPTGEENEDVELELKGVKLYVKRGEKPFSDGVTGHVKLLSNKATLDERLLFRREPLWQVTMNVRVHPSMRCTLDEEEKVLRIITKGAVEHQDDLQEDRKFEVVIYALKPGRSCSKQDFIDFAKSLIESPGLKVQ